MTSIIASSLLLTSMMNSPYPHDFTVIPCLEFRYESEKHWYFRQESSARTNPNRIDTMNPITARWLVEGGMSWGGAKIGVGHYSEHGIDREYSATESTDFIRLEYRLDYK
jgi:hypothetical protein